MKRADTIIHVLIIMLIVAGVSVVAINHPEHSIDEHRQNDPDRARFLLECQYDWMLSNEECRRLLEGGDPPEKPPEWTGC